MAKIDIDEPTAEGDGWRFDVRVTEGGRRHDFAVTLRRDDLARWAPPDTPPARVVRAAFTFLLRNEPVTAILSSFDCSVIRRYFPEVDRELPGLL